MNNNPRVILSNDKHDKNDIEKVQKVLEEFGIKVLKSDESNKGQWEGDTKRAIAAFNIHHKGREIVDKHKEVWENFVKDHPNPAKAGEEVFKHLSVWDENSELIINDLIIQYSLIGETAAVTE